MGNFNAKYELTDENLRQCEYDVLTLAGIPMDQIQQKNVNVGEYNSIPVFIRTIICGDETKPKLVFIHGYGTSGPMYYKIIQKLTQYFCVIFHDMIGMGGSSRPENFDKMSMTPQESIDYFVEYIEQWRITMSSCFLRSGEYQEFTNFYLVAHSFGGFISGNYSLKYNQHIKKLILCSPVGIKPQSIEESQIDPMDRFKGKKGPPAPIRFIANQAWKKRISPFEAMRFFGMSISLKILDGYIRNRQKVTSQHQVDILRDYLFHVLRRPGPTEGGMMISFDISLQSLLPLGVKEKFCSPTFPIPISFIYGENDWTRVVDQDFAKQCVKVNSEQFPDSKFYLLPDSDHHLHMDNHKGMTNIIINDLLGYDLPVLSLEEQLIEEKQSQQNKQDSQDTPSECEQSSQNVSEQTSEQTTDKTTDKTTPNEESTLADDQIQQKDVGYDDGLLPHCPLRSRINQNNWLQQEPDQSIIIKKTVANDTK